MTAAKNLRGLKDALGAGVRHALVDAAADEKVGKLLTAHEVACESLFEGPSAEALAGVAPYVVEIEPESPFLDHLLDQGWGRGWATFLESGASLGALRAHFRQFPMVRDPQGKMFYFRFYDPRVLRSFLPACNPAECEQFFGPVQAFYLEGEEPGTLLKVERRGRAAATVVKV